MERSEPALVPEWLKGTGNISGGGSTNHHSASSSLHTDDHAVTHPTRNRSSLSFGDYDSPRSSAFSDRTSSSYFRRSSSSNGSMAHGKDPSSYSRSYNSFGRSHREKDWEKDLLDFNEKERSVLGEHRDRGYSDSLGISSNALTNRLDKDALRRSQSMISGKRGDVWPKRVTPDSSNGKTDSQTINNGANVGASVVSNIHKATFERDFPSLGAEERQLTPEIGRVSSPGLSSAVQSLPVGTSSVLSEGWTSALVEVPVMIGNNSIGLSSTQQTAPASSTTSTPSTTTGRNMAETLAQVPSRARTAPQLSSETQRLEVLAIKQSRQLIPVTPSMPKASVMNSEKPKAKTLARIGETSLANKIGQQQLTSPQLVNPSLHGGAARSDVGKGPHGGKLLVLKPAREKNGISPGASNGLSPTNAGRVANNPPATASLTALTSPKSTKVTPALRKVSVLPATLASSMEKRPTTSQVRSRNDFFNSMRKKASTSPSSAASDPSSVVSTVLKKSSESVTEVGAAPVSPQGSDFHMDDSSGLDWSTINGSDLVSNGNLYDESHGNNGSVHPNPDEIVHPDEEEAAFLRSLGWNENEEGGGLTPEEINGFYECLEMKPSLKLCRGSHQLKIMSLLDSHVDNLGGSASSGLSSSDS